MKKILLSFLLITGLLAFPFVQAQEDSTAEVDRILSEIEMTPAAEVEELPAPEMVESAVAEEDAVEESAEAEMVPEVVLEEAAEEEMSDPTSVPAINLEEAVQVDGLEIRGSDDTRSGLITLSYEDVKLADMVRIFAQTSGANIIIPEGMNELVSGNLNDVYWQEALDVILADKGYVLVERKSGIYTISTRDQMAAEPLATETLDLQFITAEAALPAVQSLITSSNASVTPLPQTNVLIISETAERIQEIKRLVKIVDQPRRQVFIEAKFVELNDSAIKDLGINWQVLQGYTVRATGLSSEYERVDTRSSQDAQVLATTRARANQSTSTRETDLALPGITTGGNESVGLTNTSSFDGGVRGSNFTSFDAENGSITSVPTMEQIVTKQAVLSADDFALTLSALQQLDGTKIVSNPKMLVANGETATIHVGRNEPNVRAIPQGDNASSFAYVLDGFIEIGVKLEVTPTISTDKNITVNIIPELSRLIGEKTVGEAGTSFPITQIRKIRTEFAVESGKTVAIGGLTQTEDQENVKKIPLLGDLPIIGKYLFTHTSTQKVQDEIIIFVTVDSTHTERMNDRDGIPNHGTLIHTWLDNQAKIEADNLKAEETAAALE
ncbi:MAG: secretin N-terminal domain-containing protein [Kiritimatiellia bacterium]